MCSTTSTGFKKDTLLASKDKLRPYIFSAQSQALFAQQPGRDITFTRNTIQPRHIESCRQSYINAILIQSRGTAPRKACDRCLKKSATGRTKTTVKRFAECRVVKGHFDGCCANCKWSDAGNKCSFVRNEHGKEFLDEVEDGEGHEDVKGDVKTSEGGEVDMEREDESEEEKIRYESVNESNEENKMVEREEECDILRRLLLPDFVKSSNEQLKDLVTPAVKEENYSSEEEWQGFPP